MPHERKTWGQTRQRAWRANPVSRSCRQTSHHQGDERGGGDRLSRHGVGCVCVVASTLGTRNRRSFWHRILRILRPDLCCLHLLKSHLQMSPMTIHAPSLPLTISYHLAWWEERPFQTFQLPVLQQTRSGCATSFVVFLPGIALYLG